MKDEPIADTWLNIRMTKELKQAITDFADNYVPPLSVGAAARLLLDQKLKQEAQA